MFFIRQGATHKVLIGPVVAVANGYVPVTTLALSTADEAEALVHDSATVVDISGYTWAAVTTADGYYVLTLQSGISGTVGHMTVLINDDSLCLPVKAEFTVVEEAVYDALYAASATGVPAAGALEATLTTIKGATYAEATDSLEALRNRGDAAWITATGFATPTNITAGTITTVSGNVDGSVGSVTGAVGSVTGAVGSVTGAVGSVTGAVASVTADVNADVKKINGVTIVGDGSATPFNV